jgi:CubicO group peptidase (beta-lactamase class C family)
VLYIVLKRTFLFLLIALPVLLLLAWTSLYAASVACNERQRPTNEDTQYLTGSIANIFIAFQCPLESCRSSSPASLSLTNTPERIKADRHSWLVPFGRGGMLSPPQWRQQRGHQGAFVRLGTGRSHFEGFVNEFDDPAHDCSKTAGTAADDSIKGRPFKGAEQRNLEHALHDAGVTGLALAEVRAGQAPRIVVAGLARPETGQPVTADTLFQAASLTKPVFAFLVLRLMDQGLLELDLDRPLSHYAPVEVRQDRYFRASVADEREELITARMALSHSTGLTNVFPEDAEPGPLAFEPGERFAYSGEGYNYLQRVIEHLMAAPLDELAQRHVFKPLGMTASYFVWSEAVDQRLAHGHAVDGRRGEPWVHDEALAGWTLYTSVSDYARFVYALVERRGLDPAHFDLLFAPQIPVDSNGRSGAWSLGLGLFDSHAGPAFWHWGDIGLYRGMMAGTLGSGGRGYVMLSNSANAFRLLPVLAPYLLGGEDLLLTARGYAVTPELPAANVGVNMADLAWQIISQNASVRPGERVWIKVDGDADASFVDALAVAVGRVEAHPVITRTSNPMLRGWYEQVPDSVDAKPDPWLWGLYDTADVLIEIDALDYGIFALASEARHQTWEEANGGVIDRARQRGVRILRIGNGLYPEPGRARSGCH